MMDSECETCWHYDYDEEYEAYTCNMDLDEDEYYHIHTAGRCPYYRRGDEYSLARKQ